ncbi:uncharacterized protein HMPREF1541_00475 [Cyphellophora europaea CBS 101466]|uniref:Zn(2)-C6 fungal-type domain-containing protein n=1 Tax=Cyphellophora europaea (strain CBS 101466) TaxID=1220924 RepID=W2SC37_CYPE1|nr:uncharacterized protein HMPREF1541_00475 [Cyphellophora europaea CBS 101466]ETN46291.1 hypothetical protein HMPREF1541_00475 [Cyphellophora europaea CBS 101466]
MHDTYGAANPFSADSMETDDPAPPARTNSTPRAASSDPDALMSAKKHAACDECRKRKLKCSGEPAGCTRCVKYSIPCIYSPQKQMGRPKKRQRQEDTNTAEPASSSTSQPFVDPNLTTADIDRTNFENICNGALSGGLRNTSRKASHPMQSLDNTPPSDNPRTPSDSDIFNLSYPTDYSLWPDFSDTTLPMPLQDTSAAYNPKPTSNGGDPTFDPDTDPATLSTLPSIPDCPCLPNLYLTLSTLSTLSAFPVTSHTITTLSSAHRTAHSVIYCAICPQKFQSGSQNVMLSNTLITVLVDQWQRVLKCPASALEKGFSSSPPSAHMSAITELEWKTFAYDLMRAFVFGDRTATPPPTSSPAPGAMPPSSAEITTLMGLAESMERRQKQWHGHENETGEFPKRMTHDLALGHAAGLTLDDIRKMEDDVRSKKNGPGEHFLCLQLVTHAKNCIRSLDRGPPVLGECGQR